MVCLNGDWVQVGTIDRVYGPAQSGRYYLTTGQLASVYGRYGFDADAYNANNSQCFGHAEAGKNVWTDAPIAWENGEKLTQIFYSHNSTKVFEVYYMPGQLHNNVAPETAKANNAYGRSALDPRGAGDAAGREPGAEVGTRVQGGGSHV